MGRKRRQWRREVQNLHTDRIVHVQLKHPRPGHFIQVKAAGTKSLIENLVIKNYPAHGFTLGGSNLVVKNVELDNSAGNAPNSLSGGKPAAHKYDNSSL